MGAFFAYILKAALCLIAYYLFYKLLFSKETFHRFNRIALVSLMLLSLVLPFVHYSTTQGTAGTLQVEEVLVVAYSATGNVVNTEAQIPFTMQIIAWAMILYFVGVVLMAVRSLVIYVSLAKVLKIGKVEDNSKYGLPKKVRLIVHNKPMSPFSWMNYIVVSGKDLEEASESILAHEMGHVSNHHTLDLIFTELCLVFQWFNPAMWLMRQELQAIHEYEADEAVLDFGVNAKQYQLLIIKKAAGSRLQSITNSLHQSSIKKRITMMLKQKSNPWAKAKLLVALPLAVFCVSCLSSPEASEITDQVSEGKVSDIFSDVQDYSEISLLINAKGQILVTDGTNSPVYVADADLNSFLTSKITDKSAAIHINADKETPMAVVTNVKNILRNIGVSKVSYSTKSVVNEQLSTQNKPVATENGDVFTVVEEQPEFPGGERELMSYIKSTLKYPRDCADEGIQGRVTLSFVIDTDGSVIEAEPMRSPDDRLTAEAIRIVESMPKWKPGRQGGEAVRVKYVIPVTFRLQ